MKPTVQAVKTAFGEPSRGGYGSEWQCTDTSEGVLTELHAEWAPRHSTPTVLVTDLTSHGGSLLVSFRHEDGYGGWAEGETKATEDLVSLLADQASEG